jgi:hypothetical protein
MADDTTTTPDGATVPLGDSANIPVNGPLSADGAAAQDAPAPKKGKNAPPPPMDQTTPGGRYVLASGATVDADGNEL